MYSKTVSLHYKINNDFSYMVASYNTHSAWFLGIRISTCYTNANSPNAVASYAK